MATSCFHHVQGRRMHARVAGTGKDVVLVHGLLASHRYWEPTLERLGRRFRAWAPDLPGYGLSQKGPPQSMGQQAHALDAWMEAAGIHRAHVLGNSAGCQTAAALAQHHPGRVDRLVLHGPTIDPEHPSFLRQALRWTRAMLREPYRPVRTAWRDARDLGLLRAVQQARLMFDDRIEERLPHITAPTLVVRGRRDPIVPQRWAEEVRRMLPNGRLAVVPGSHIINKTQPEVLVDAVSGFLSASNTT